MHWHIFLLPVPTGSRLVNAQIYQTGPGPKMTCISGPTLGPDQDPAWYIWFLVTQSNWFKNRAEAAVTSRHDPLCPDLF